MDLNTDVPCHAKGAVVSIAKFSAESDIVRRPPTSYLAAAEPRI
jgi:hypothetical protein